MHIPKDRFNVQAEEYAKFRPLYPDSLYDVIFQFVKHFDDAWDCGTGNGQVARILSDRFRNVYATDISVKQIEQAPLRENISYRIERAEFCSSPNGIFDLITVAQAIHWFDFDAFYQQVQRVLKPQGLLAIWAYGNIQVNEEIDQKINYLYHDILSKFWDAERVYIDEKMQSIPFPFCKQRTYELNMEVSWSPVQLFGYIKTWSAWQHYYKEYPEEETNERSVIARFCHEVTSMWPLNEKRTLRFPVYLRLGNLCD